MLKRSGDLDLMFQALADPARRSIVERLTRGPASLGQLAEPLAMSLPAVAQHLRVLVLSGLVTTRKVGRQRICELDGTALRLVGRWLSGRTFWENCLEDLGDYLDEKEKLRRRVDPVPGRSS